MTFWYWNFKPYFKCN